MILSALLHWIHNSTEKKVGSQGLKPLRAEFFGREELLRRAHEVAEAHTLLKPKRGRSRIRARLLQNFSRLEEAYALFSESSEKKELLPSGAQWILDNFHIVRHQFREIRRDLPRKYQRNLPRVLDSTKVDVPRVYDLVCHFISHTDSAVDPDLLADFVESYQRDRILSIGEVWAVPIMLRVALLENLRRLIDNIARVLQARQRIDAIFSVAFHEKAASSSDGSLALIRELSINLGELPVLAAPLLRKLRSHGSGSFLALQWVEEKLREAHLDPHELQRNEEHLQAADLVSVGNVVTSLRTIDSWDWRAWFEKVNHVHQVLLGDPAGIYAKSTFDTRDAARRRVELLARKGKREEVEVATASITLSREYHQGTLENQVSFYLLGGGRCSFAKKLGLKASALDVVINWASAWAFPLYCTAFVLLTVGTTLLLLVTLRRGGSSWWLALGGALIALPFVSEFATRVTQYCATKLVAPRPLPRLDYEKEIAPSAQTIVVVHGIGFDNQGIERAVEGLEIRFLGNQSPLLSYGLLLDIPDSDKELTVDDRGIGEFARSAITRLNRKYGFGPTERFFLLVRGRRWSESEQRFICWERKRGKLVEFNRWLRGATDTSFLLVHADHAKLSLAPYVITLDLDTQLPPGTAWKLIGTIDHPLHHPVVNHDKRIVTSGYGVIQPRVDTDWRSFRASAFSELFSGQSGLDPYSRLVSDVYQDLFGEGSYVGKGIYAVDVFEEVLHDRTPKESLLSHDLFEGLFARVGFASDIELFDGFPSRVHSFARRQHRWIRGDWQLLSWIGKSIPDASWNPVPTPLSPLGRFKLFDNLRRSFVESSLVLSFWFTWCVIPGAVSWIHAEIFGMLFFSTLVNAWDQFGPRSKSDKKLILPLAVHEVALEIGRTLSSLILAPFYGFTALHAIVVTLYRRHISCRHLLEWESMGAAERRFGGDFSSFARVMLPSWIVTVILALTTVLIGKGVIIGAAPVLMLWIIAPLFAWALSQKGKHSGGTLTEEERSFVYEMGLATWRYFDRYLTPEYNYLIPDNLQVLPEKTVAERTSPTNIGLSILSVLSAYDLGFIALSQAIEKVQHITETLTRLERFQGHFLNWYELRTLRALPPRYVSTVDSGNLIGHLMVLHAFCEKAPYEPLVEERFTQFISRTLGRELSLDVTDLGSMWESLKIVKQEIARLPVGNVISTDLTEALNRLDRLLSWIEFLPRLKELGEAQALPSKLRRIERVLTARTPSLSLIRKIGDRFIERIGDTPLATNELREFLECVRAATKEAQELIETNARIASRAETFLKETDFSFLYDKARNLFVIGYNLESGAQDRNYYDLLASEARLTSIVAIAKGDVPAKHWFVLGRPVTKTPGGNALLSWSGTMFEYLMPCVVCEEAPGTLLGESNHAAVVTQQHYTRFLGIPWGISESGYSGVDFERTYQYRAFGVPGLGLKRGLADDLVISPYSSALALEITPHAVVKNLERLKDLGAYGEFGFYESVDFTPQRLSAEERCHVVKSFFAHHQGMSLVAVTNCLLQGKMRERFHSHPLIHACDFLLHERFPIRIERTDPPQSQHLFNSLDDPDKGERSELILTPHTIIPRTHVISNGTYSLHIDNAGCGESYVKEPITLTRWSPDPLRNRLGTFLYLRDTTSGAVWSSTYEPTRVEPDHYEARFDPDKAEFVVRHKGISTKTEVVVSPEESVEVRKVTLTNLGSERRRIEYTTYGEVVLGHRGGDKAHPAFSKLSIESDFLDEFDALVFKRRPRSQGEKELFLAHSVVTQAVWAPVQFDSKRDSFIGRGRSLADPIALSNPSLARNRGIVLDPIFSLRSVIEIEPASSHELYFVTAYAESQEEILRLIKKYKEILSLRRVFELSWNQSDVEIRHTQVSMKLVRGFYHLANGILYPIQAWRGPKEALEQNRLGQSALWRFGISGDYPIVIVLLTDPEQVQIAQDAVMAHEYLRRKGITFDLILLNEFHGGYLQTFQEELDFLLRTGAARGSIEQRGGIYLRSGGQLSQEERRLLLAYARVVLYGTKGSFVEQLVIPTQVLKPVPPATRTYSILARPLLDTPALRFYNEYGGFAPDGKSYLLDVSRSKKPPRPWSNVVANERFGFLVTESGGGFTWAGNSRENRLSPWSNDPVIDPVSEVIYVRDSLTGEFWSLTPKPCGEAAVVEHRFGSTTFIGKRGDLEHELTLCGSADDRVKWWQCIVKNRGDRTRTLSVFLYFEWVLGVTRETSSIHLRSKFDAEREILSVENPSNSDWPTQVVFVGSSEKLSGFTSNRAEFLGRYGDVENPALLASYAVPQGLSQLLRGGLGGVSLSRQVGRGFDSAAVLKVELTLAPGEEKEILFYVAQADSSHEATVRSKEYRSPRYFRSAQEKAKEFWRSRTDAVQVQTPDLGFDTLLNGWLLYQTMSGRMFGRTGFYQSSGALGFRDQLQDSLALLIPDPARTRAQILLHAGRQFPEGDVQHWWHPPTGRGVRTKIKDNYLWLPYAVAEYLDVTADEKILDESVGFLEGAIPKEEDADLYFQPGISAQRAALYEHCARALDRADLSERGIPLIGHGDWNDGFNQIGPKGKGESVWLGWFLAAICDRFAPLAERRGEAERAASWRQKSKTILAALEAYAWDGAWYRRAFFDDGSAVGSAQNAECQIDSIAQSWAVITNLAPQERKERAFQSLIERLVDPTNKILPLLTPPFDKSVPSPGYIQGYPPGIRENGGQYTHGAVWSVVAAAALKKGELTHRLFSYLNPIGKGDSRGASDRYKNEPYVLSGDVYSYGPLEGLGGWSWYTGSSGWMYRVALEHILGIKVRGDFLELDPVIPPIWKEWSVTLRRDGKEIAMNFKNPRGAESGVSEVVIGGQKVESKKIQISSLGSGRTVVEVVVG